MSKRFAILLVLASLMVFLGAGCPKEKKDDTRQGNKALNDALRESSNSKKIHQDVERRMEDIFRRGKKR